LFGGFSSTANTKTLIAVDEDNNVYTWGYNGHNNIIPGPTIHVTVPTKISVGD
jgi:alpha-tubulin suppressor-like RCC1 family protein